MFDCTIYTSYESLLQSWVDDVVKEELFKSLGQCFLKELRDNMSEGNWLKIAGLRGVSHFRNQDDFCFETRW